MAPKPWPQRHAPQRHARSAMPLSSRDTPIPHHQLVKFLGHGAMGEVWLVRGPGGVNKAAKFIRLEHRYGIKELLAIQRMKQIHHAHLVQITDVWLLDDDDNVIPDAVIDQVSARLSTGGDNTGVRATLAPELPVARTLVVAMTLADESLFDRLKTYRAQGREGIPYDELIRHMQEAAKGIDFLNQPHEVLGGKSIQHCDIKPQNLLLVGGSVQLCDFGLTRLAGENKTANQLEGTLAYIAPEAARGEKPSATTDQYSLAISYYELRTGRVPFDENASAVEIIQFHTTGKLDFSHVSEAERKVLRKATALDPAQRYPTNYEFVAALSAANAPAEPRRASWPWYASAAILLALLALIGVVATAFLKTPPIPLVEFPPHFQPVAGIPHVVIGGRAYPKQIVRQFGDGESVVFLLVDERREEKIFYIMRDKVWNGLFRKYLAEKPEAVVSDEWTRGGRTLDQDVGAEDAQLPALRMTVDEAYGFAIWLAGEDKGHLPSIEQWDTAAGLHRPERAGRGPFVEPFQPGEIAVNRKSEGPLHVGAAIKDISPFGVRDMAGNGTEFTRTIWGGRQEVPLHNATNIDAVVLRGRSYASTDGPLLYQDLQNSEQDLPWPYTAPSPYIGFRVVLHKLTAPSARGTSVEQPSS